MLAHALLAHALDHTFASACRRHSKSALVDAVARGVRPSLMALLAMCACLLPTCVQTLHRGLAAHVKT